MGIIRIEVNRFTVHINDVNWFRGSVLLNTVLIVHVYLHPNSH